MQLLRAHVALIGQHVEMDVHRPLPAVGDAENVDAARPDGQERGQEVPQRLQPTLPLGARVDKLSRCTA